MLATFARSFVLPLLMLAGAQTPSAASATTQKLPDMPDIPAMLLRAEDLAEAGIDDPVYSFGATCRDPQQQAQMHANQEGLSFDEALERLEDVGWLRICGGSLGRIAGGGAPGPDARADYGVSSYVHVYEDDRAAEAGFELFEDESDDPSAEDLDEGTDLGDQSEATLTRGSDNGGEYASLDLALRLDNLVGGVTIRDYSGGTPDIDLAENLADLLQDRIDDVLDGETPGLSTMVLRLEGDSVQTTSDRYGRLDGAEDQGLGETDVDFERRTEETRRVDASYLVNQRLTMGTGDVIDDYLYIASIFAFPTERAAGRYLDDAPERLEANPDTFDVVVRDDSPQFGDESLSINNGATLNSGQAMIYDRIYARVGTYVVSVAIRGQMVPIGIAEAVIDDQIACVEDGGCIDPIPVPARILGSEEASSSTSHSGAGMTSYESELYPLTLSYGDDWDFQEPQIIGDTEILSMNNGVSGVVIIADVTHEGDVDACLDGAITYIEDDPAYDDIEPLEDAQGDPIEGRDNDVAFAAIRYTDDSGDDRVLYAQCRVIEPGESTVEVSQFMAEDDAEEQIAALEDLLVGLEIGD